MTKTESNLDQYQSVGQWKASYLRFWGTELPEHQALPALERFVAFSESTPDNIVGEVLRPAAEGDKSVLRTRARRKYMRLIDDFERQEGSRRTANYVRSFLIHNGVAMNPSVLR